MINKKRKLDLVGISLIKSPMAAQSDAWVCGRSLAGIVVSNAAGSIGVCLLLVLSVVSTGHCVGLITRPEESSRVGCV